jgi:CheY-like chemotaxis protein
MHILYCSVGFESSMGNCLLGMEDPGAGSDRYLTKPFEAEKLLEIVHEYVQ